MSDGQVLEYDSPRVLMENKKSELFDMVNKTGAEASYKLYEMAMKSEVKRTFS